MSMRSLSERQQPTQGQRLLRLLVDQFSIFLKAE